MLEKVWLRCSEMCAYLGVSRPTIERRRVPYQPDFVPHRIRYKELLLDEGGTSEPRYFKPDADAMLRDPAPHREVRYTPKFHV
jgi:hypothetical protein